MRPVRLACAESGETQAEFVARLVQGAGTGRQTAPQGPGPSGSRRSPEAEMTAKGISAGVEAPKANVGSSPTPATNNCPDCGDPLVWNKILKKWVCECGFQGKVQR